MNSSTSWSLPLPFRSRFTNRTQIVVPEGAVLLYGVFEERSEIDEGWLNLFGPENVFEVIPTDNLLTLSVPRYSSSQLSLRNQNELTGLAEAFRDKTVYLDITGLPHHVWMPILRSCLRVGQALRIIYVEPEGYTTNPNPKPGEFFDLSDSLQGLQPIPGFAKLRLRRAEMLRLVPLLGFEGIRFRYLVEQLEPSERDIFPVIGVPGFKPSYPFHTYEGNSDPLAKTRSWQRVRYVDASCPFSLFKCLESIAAYPGQQSMQVATIGTKPHALGAALYTIVSPAVELIYDHPVRRKKRSSGMGVCHVYFVTEFVRGHMDAA